MLDEIHIRLTLMDLTLTTLSCLFLLVWPIHYARMQYPRVVMSSATVASLVSIRNRVVTRQQPQRSFQIRPSTMSSGGEMTFQSGARLMSDSIRRHHQDKEEGPIKSCWTWAHVLEKLATVCIGSRLDWGWISFWNESFQVLC